MLDGIIVFSQPEFMNANSVGTGDGTAVHVASHHDTSCANRTPGGICENAIHYYLAKYAINQTPSYPKEDHECYIPISCRPTNASS